MGTHDDSDIYADDVIEAFDEAHAITPAPVAESDAQPIWARRSFLKAAALGTAAAALISKSPGGLRLGPLPVAADDLSTFQCTAGDVEILGTGQIIDEPCSCTGTFQGTVRFQVRNNANSDRGCITVHLANGVDIDLTLEGTDPTNPVNRIIPGKQTKFMTGRLTFNCGAGLVCFGEQSDGRGRCDPGKCSTVTWTVPGQDTCPPTRQISSKCRHQRICIQGRGTTTLDCNTGTDGVQTACQVNCGATTTLRLCTTSGTDLGPFKFKLDDGAFSDATTDTCKNFTVGPLTAPSTSFTGTVKDASGCEKSATVTVTTTAVTPTITLANENPCNGVLKFSVPQTCSSITWTIDDVAAANTSTDDLLVRVNADGTLEYRPFENPNKCHKIGVTATCGGCTGTNTKRVQQGCVTTTVDCGANPIVGSENAASTAAQTQDGKQKARKGRKQKSRKGGKQRSKGKRTAPKKGSTKGAAKKRN
jgi:hypothetical protein